MIICAVKTLTHTVSTYAMLRSRCSNRCGNSAHNNDDDDIIDIDDNNNNNNNGLRPQHLRDLILCREAGSELLCSLTAFTSMLLQEAARLTLPRFSSEGACLL